MFVVAQCSEIWNDSQQTFMANETEIAQNLWDILNGTVDLGNGKTSDYGDFTKAKIGQSHQTKMIIGLSVGLGSCFIVILVICVVFYHFCNIEKTKKRMKRRRPKQNSNSYQDNGRNRAAKAVDKLRIFF